MTLHAAIFDFDGVLADSEAIAVAAEQAHLASAGLTYAHDDYVSRFCGLHDTAFHTALDADAVARTGRPLGAAFFASMKAAIRTRMMAELRAVPHVPETLPAIALPKAVASSSTKEALARKMALIGLAAHFGPHIYSGDHVARAKPAPDLFLFAAERLGAAPEACVAIEDSVNGVRAAVAAGMIAIGFTGGGHCPPGLEARLRAAGACDVTSDFRALPSLIGSL